MKDINIHKGNTTNDYYSSGCVTFDDINDKIDEIIWVLSSDERISEREKKIDNLLKDE